MCFEIKYRDEKSGARVGMLKTKSGEKETPFFMPVATKATLKHLTSDDLESMNAGAIITNTFILSLRPGAKIIKNSGGTAKFMNYKGIVFSDSGGFQMYSPKLYVKSEEDGVIFRNPYSGEKLFMTPEENMKIQLELNSDVAMCLDTMPLYGDSIEAIKEAVRKTTLWAQRCKKYHDSLQKKTKKEKRQLLFGITQGGIHDELRKESAMQISKINFDGYALGGLALGEPKEDEYRMIEVAKKIIPENKPVYLMGAGEPLELLEAISRGIDIFDSRFPTKNARHGKISTWNGFLNVTNLSYRNEKKPLDENCDCFVCRKYSRQYIAHLLRHEEATGYRLASYHNIYFLQKLMARAREEIKKGTFSSFLAKMRKIYSNAS